MKMNLKNVEVIETSKPKTNNSSLLKTGAIVALTAGATMPAFAEFDPSSLVTTITGFVAGVSAIGLAVLSLVVTGKVFKWVRTAL